MAPNSLHHRTYTDIPAAFHAGLERAVNTYPSMPWTASSSTKSQSNVPTGTPIPSNSRGQYQPQFHFSPPAGFTNDPNVVLRIRERSETTPTNPHPIKIQIRQNGTLHFITLPIGRPCSTREIEQLQEYAQNSNFGTTNIFGDANCAINKSLAAYNASTRFQKIQGGLFDGLTQDEAAFLEELAWKTCSTWYGEKLSAAEIVFLYEAGLPGTKPVLPAWAKLPQGFKLPPARRVPYKVEDDTLDDINVRFARL
ncbi:hypothetical protein E8E11_007538 [Didymella keratinophila]|nr:hypothetical protein E8E11_007538 [Didymella keratinophila]